MSRVQVLSGDGVDRLLRVEEGVRIKYSRD